MLKKAPNTTPVARQSEDRLITPNIEQKTIIAEKTIRTHVVEKGETLSGISAKYYGSPHYWQKILAANDAVLKDPDRLIPGTRLVIPQ